MDRVVCLYCHLGQVARPSHVWRANISYPKRARVPTAHFEKDGLPQRSRAEG